MTIDEIIAFQELMGQNKYTKGLVMLIEKALSIAPYWN